MRVGEKGQVTIPKMLRDQLGLGAGSEVAVELRDGCIVIRKVDDAKSRGARLTARLRNRGDVSMTTDEILALTRGE
jgi:AbrB family looped-hinge helix DNA binding protein